MTTTEARRSRASDELYRAGVEAYARLHGGALGLLRQAIAADRSNARAAIALGYWTQDDDERAALAGLVDRHAADAGLRARAGLVARRHLLSPEAAAEA